MIVKIKPSILISCLIFVALSNSQAANLTVPEQLTSLMTEQGQTLFYRSAKNSDYWPLSIHYVTQKGLTYCAIASSVMVLNALNIVAPQDNVYKPYRLFTQDNFFTPEVLRFINIKQVKKQGVTLKAIAQALATFSVKVSVMHANDTTLAQFRQLAEQVVNSKQRYMIVNYDRSVLNEVGEGHMSPLAAYDKSTDKFLIMDVARYKYPPVWVSTTQLWNAINTVDKDAKAYRGFITIENV